MHENSFNNSYRIPSGMLIVFLEKALTLIHMETHLDDVSTFTATTARQLPASLALTSLILPSRARSLSNLSLARTHS